MSTLNVLCRGLPLVVLFFCAGCNTVPSQPETQRVVDTSSPEFQAAQAHCDAFMRERFNPYQTFDDPIFPTSGVQRRMNRRTEYQRMYRACMSEQGFDNVQVQVPEFRGPSP